MLTEVRHKMAPRRRALLAAAAWMLVCGRLAGASTYVVYLPLDSPIYDQLDTLNGLGLLYTYIPEVRPIARIEAARLTREAEHNLALSEGDEKQELAWQLIDSLREQLAQEIRWLESNSEDRVPAALVTPLERVEAQYVFSKGDRRSFGPRDVVGEQLQAKEATPLLPDNDDLPTSPRSNEVLRAASWAGFMRFLTVYGEGATAGPLTRAPAAFSGGTTDRFRLLRGEVVVSAGNTAVSWGQQETWWGTGYFSSLSQGDNAQTFPALRIQNIHPSHLPLFLRYLGPFRAAAFLGQLDHDRFYSRPWLSGQIIAFKPLPSFEFGFFHTVMFGGRFNDQYGALGFVGRVTGLSTGNPNGGNSNSQAGLYGKFIFRRLRNMELYQEVNGEDNLTLEVPKLGRLLPFAAPSFKGGIDIPRLTADGLTTAHFEYSLLSQRYGFHSDSLYWTYKGRLMGDPIGPNGTSYELQVGRWINYSRKVNLDLFVNARDPELVNALQDTENSAGFALQTYQSPSEVSGLFGSLRELRALAAFEWVHDLNYVPGNNSFRVAIQLSVSISPSLNWVWH